MVSNKVQEEIRGILVDLPLVGASRKMGKGKRPLLEELSAKEREALLRKRIRTQVRALISDDNLALLLVGQLVKLGLEEQSRGKSFLNISYDFNLLVRELAVGLPQGVAGLEEVRRIHAVLLEDSVGGESQRVAREFIAEVGKEEREWVNDHFKGFRKDAAEAGVSPKTQRGFINLSKAVWILIHGHALAFENLVNAEESRHVAA